jgi:hypothetical protein
MPQESGWEKPRFSGVFLHGGGIYAVDIDATYVLPPG